MNNLIGLATLGSALVGLLGLVAALIAFLDGEFLASATFLLASAVALGLLAKSLIGN